MYTEKEYSSEGMSKTNLQKLKILVDELETYELSDKNYSNILSNIVKIIEKERAIISKLVKSDKKINHYEKICSAILSLISKTVG